MIKVTTWFDKYRLVVAVYLNENNTACMQDSLWCILLLVARNIAVIAAILCKSLYGHGTLLYNQHHTLKRLVFDVNIKVGMIGILLEVQHSAIDKRSPSFLSEVSLMTWACL